MAGDDAGSTSVDQATVLIRQAIVTGQYGPGERIKVVDLTHRFGLSAMPVREALRKLEGEGIITIAPNRGAIVRTVDRKFIADLYEVRTTLELLAVRRCMERMTLEKIEYLDVLRIAHDKAVERGDISEILETNRTLHVALFEIGGNVEATRLFQRGWELVNALRLRFGYRGQRLTVIMQEHRLLLDAFRRLDVEAAESIIRMHNLAGMEDLLGSFKVERC